jgi:hypothetical protein
MAHQHEDNENLSPQEIKFNDCIRRGDDFIKISQYAYAKECYLEALELHFNDNIVNKIIEETIQKQKYARITVIKILVAAVLIIAAVWIYKTQF